jgi:hypothetical protein
MLNLVEKFTPAVEATNDEGLVTVEWIALLAGVAAVAGAVVAFGWDTVLSDKIKTALGV